MSYPGFSDCYLEVKLTARPCEQCDTEVYINAFGGLDLLIVSASGDIKGGVARRSGKVTVDHDGSLHISVTYHSVHPMVLLGTSQQGRGSYEGSGREQYVFSDLHVHALERRADEKLILVDIGAAGGVDGRWLPFSDALQCILFEPSADGASALRKQFGTNPALQVYEMALSDVVGPHELNVTRFPECSSLRKPNWPVLEDFNVAPAFTVVDRVPIECTRYDALADAPDPDVIKIDVQGMEYEVLQGFGHHLDRVLAVELEAHFYEIYIGQKLVADLVELLAKRGLFLQRIVPQMSFDDRLVEANLYFVRNNVDRDDLWKIEIIKKVYDLPAMNLLGHWVEKTTRAPSG